MLNSNTLEHTSIKPERNLRRINKPQVKTDCLRFSIFCGGVTGEVRQSWVDGKDAERLERHLREIVVSIIVAGEEQYREVCQWCYKREVARRKELIEEAQKQKEETERKEQEQQAAFEKAKLDHLLDEADRLRKAADIRQYTETVLALWEQGKIDTSSEAVMRWMTWANAQADRIDPIKSRQFLDSFSDKDTKT